MSIKKEIQEILKKTLTELQIDYEQEIEVSIPKDKNHGNKKSYSYRPSQN